MPPVLACVTPGALHMAGRQGSGGSTLMHGVVALISFPGATFYVCIPHLAHWKSQHEKSGAPEDQYHVVQGTAWQQTSRFTSAQVDLSPSGNTGLAGFGLCPSVVLWKNKATEGLTTFRIPREAVHWPLGILTLYCINLAGNM